MTAEELTLDMRACEIMLATARIPTPPGFRRAHVQRAAVHGRFVEVPAWVPREGRPGGLVLTPSLEAPDRGRAWTFAVTHARTGWALGYDIPAAEALAAFRAFLGAAETAGISWISLQRLSDLDERRFRPLHNALVRLEWGRRHGRSWCDAVAEQRNLRRPK